MNKTLESLILDKDFSIYNGTKKLTPVERDACYDAFFGDEIRLKKEKERLSNLEDCDLIQLIRRKVFGYVLNVGDLKEVLRRYPDDAILLVGGKEIQVVKPGSPEEQEGGHGEELTPILFEEE